MKVSRFDSTRATNLYKQNCTLVVVAVGSCVLRLHVVGDLHDLDQLHLGHNQTSVKNQSSVHSRNNKQSKLNIHRTTRTGRKTTSCVPLKRPIEPSSTKVGAPRR